MKKRLALKPTLRLGDDILPAEEDTREENLSLSLECGENPYLEKLFKLHVDSVPSKDLLAILFKEISKYRLLKVAEQKALAKRYQTLGDLEARNKLIKHSMQLVVFIAKRYRGRGLEYLDLIQEGVLGLIKAIELYDPKKANFSTYAVWWIRQSVARAICDYGKTIRLPVHIWEFMNKVIRASAELVNRLGREPKAEDIASYLEIDQRKVERILRQMKMNTVYLDDLVWEDRRGKKSYYNLPDKKENAYPLYRAIARQELEECSRDIRILLNVLDTYPKRHKNIFIAFYGLDDNLKSKTLDYVGIRLGVGRERIRQIKAEIWLTLPEQGFWKDEVWLEGQIYKFQELAGFLHYGLGSLTKNSASR